MPTPGLVDCVRDRMLDRTRETHQFPLVRAQGREQHVVIRLENRSHRSSVVSGHLVEQRLQGILAEVPLQRTEAQTLAVEIARKTGEAFGRAPAGFERSGEGEAAIVERFGSDPRTRNRTPEQRPPGDRPDRAVDCEARLFLEGLDRGLRAAAESPVDRAGIQPQGLQPFLNTFDFGAVRTELVSRHLPSTLLSATEDPNPLRFRRAARLDQERPPVRLRAAAPEFSGAAMILSA